jgi:nucleoside-diphosphate-sugar epimerase
MATTRDQVTVAVHGADTPVGRRFARGLAVDPAVLPRAVEPDDADLAEVLAGAGALVVLGAGAGDDVDGTGGAGLDVAATRRLLAAAGEAGVPRVVVLSSATVYGAWADNPVPLTEEAVLRPCPGFGYAADRAEFERAAGELREVHPTTSVAVLRTAVVVDPERQRWFDRSPWSGRRPWVSRSDAHRQLLHVDDLVAALDLAWREGLDGVLNVAPDGWVTAEALRELAGPLVPLPERVERWWRRSRRRTTVPGLDPYLHLPWVVANDRLRAAGWAPTAGTEVTLVEAQPTRWWRRIGPAQRQQLSLGVAAAVLGLLVGGVAAGVLRARRRRSR